jgi:hypothetical protein
MKDLNRLVEEAQWISNVLFEDATGKGYKGDVDVSKYGKVGPGNDTFSHNAKKSPKVKPQTNEKIKVKGSKKRMYKAGTNPEDNIREVKAAKKFPGDVSVAEFGRKGPSNASKVMVSSRPKSDGDKSKGKSYKQGSNPEDNIKEAIRVTISRVDEISQARVQGAIAKTKSMLKGTQGVGQRQQQLDTKERYRNPSMAAAGRATTRAHVRKTGQVERVASKAKHGTMSSVKGSVRKHPTPSTKGEVRAATLKGRAQTQDKISSLQRLQQSDAVRRQGKAEAQGKTLKPRHVAAGAGARPLGAGGKKVK